MRRNANGLAIGGQGEVVHMRETMKASRLPFKLFLQLFLEGRGRHLVVDWAIFLVALVQIKNKLSVFVKFKEVEIELCAGLHFF